MANAEPEQQPKADQPQGTPQPNEAKTFSVSDMENDSLKKETADWKDKYLRQLAEMENMRKRLQKERQEIGQYASESVIIDFLNPIDHMENALKYTQQMSDDVKHWAVGFQMILTQFKDALTSNGVTAYKSEGTPFDPHLHEAIEMVETDKYAPGIVVEECLLGYKMGERTIRPARVKVSKAADTASNEESSDENEENQPTK